jgi:hypothetical protein
MASKSIKKEECKNIKSPQGSNGDTGLILTIDGDKVAGIGSFHKTLPRNGFGEVDCRAFKQLVEAAADSTGAGFKDVWTTPVPFVTECDPAPLVNPQAGLAKDGLVMDPPNFSMKPAPKVRSASTAAEMTEAYWMALLRDVPFSDFPTDAGVGDAAAELNTVFTRAVGSTDDPGKLEPGIDLPDRDGKLAPITRSNLFRSGLPGEEVGPLVSQFFLRNASFGVQTIDQTILPYTAGMDYLTTFQSWRTAQEKGWGEDGFAYSKANESSPDYYEKDRRFITTMRDLARFVHKDALHQAYFNAALLLLSGGAKWTKGNPYRPPANQCLREQGFGTMGGPHILALVSEVATRALKVVWHQKWQTHLRLRPEAYGGLLHVQTLGVGSPARKRAYGLPVWVKDTEAAKRIRSATISTSHPGGTYLLPMAFTSGSPIHPAYGAGHATVAGACVTVLKAFFETEVPISTLFEKATPWAGACEFTTYVPRLDGLHPARFLTMTIEGELNKIASNVAMGRTMGGVHWRSDNTRSLQLGEVIAAQILWDITKDLNETVEFAFRTFARTDKGVPKNVLINRAGIFVDGMVTPPGSML